MKDQDESDVIWIDRIIPKSNLIGFSNHSLGLMAAILDFAGKRSVIVSGGLIVELHLRGQPSLGEASGWVMKFTGIGIAIGVCGGSGFSRTLSAI